MKIVSNTGRYGVMGPEYGIVANNNDYGANNAAQSLPGTLARTKIRKNYLSKPKNSCGQSQRLKYNFKNISRVF